MLIPADISCLPLVQGPPGSIAKGLLGVVGCAQELPRRRIGGVLAPFLMFDRSAEYGGSVHSCRCLPVGGMSFV